MIGSGQGGYRTGFVATTSPLTVRLAGSAAALPALKNAAYTPAAGDRVAVAPIDGTRLYVEGKIG